MSFRGTHLRAVLGITIAVPAVAHGALMDWAHQFGGSYHDNTNWFGGVVPGAGDVARFDHPAAASPLILFPNYDVFATQLVVNDGTWVFNLTGDDFELTSQSSVSGQESINLAQGAHWATLYVQNGTMIGHDARTSFGPASRSWWWIESDAELDLDGRMRIGDGGDGNMFIYGLATAADARLADDAGSFGLINIDGSGVLHLLGPANSVIGNHGVGSINVFGAGTLDTDDQLMIGQYSDGTGSLHVAGGTFDASDNVVVGRSGDGDLRVTAMGEADMPSATVAANIGATGSMLVHNPGSRCSIAGLLDVRNDGHVTVSDGGLLETDNVDLSGTPWSTLEIDGGTATIAENAYVGRFPPYEGRMEVQDGTEDGAVHVAGSLYVAGNKSAGDAFGRLNVFDSGQLFVDNDMVLWREALMEVESGGTAAANHLHVRGGYVEADGGHLIVSDTLTASGLNGILVSGTSAASAIVDANGAVNTPGRTQVGTEVNGFGEVLVTENSSWTSTNGVDIGAGWATLGRMEIADGSTLFSNDDVNVYPNGELVLNDGTIAAPFVDVFGTLRGSGDMDSYVTAYDGAWVRPGLSPGLMTITSNSAGFSPRTGSTIEIELGGAANSDFDRIHVAGPVEILGGTVHVKAINGFVPTVGQTFEIITSTVPAFPGGVYGTFDGVEPAANYALGYTQQTVLIKVIQTPCPPDFDGNTSVGFADLTALLNAYGPCGAPCPYDLDGSGHVGFGDLTLLLTAWGPC